MLYLQNEREAELTDSDFSDIEDDDPFNDNPARKRRLQKAREKKKKEHKKAKKRAKKQRSKKRRQHRKELAKRHAGKDVDSITDYQLDQIIQGIKTLAEETEAMREAQKQALSIIEKRLLRWQHQQLWDGFEGILRLSPNLLKLRHQREARGERRCDRRKKATDKPSKLAISVQRRSSITEEEKETEEKEREEADAATVEATTAKNAKGQAKKHTQAKMLSKARQKQAHENALADILERALATEAQSTDNITFDEFLVWLIDYMDKNGSAAHLRFLKFRLQVWVVLYIYI